MTVGYGDAVPVTFWGKMVAGVTMLASVITRSISVIGANFTQQWLHFKAKEYRINQAKHARNSDNILAEMYAYSQVVTHCATTSALHLRRHHGPGECGASVTLRHRAHGER